MQAAVVRSFDHPPRYESFDLPPASGQHEVVIDVAAAALHPRVRSGASGSHYADEKILPMIPGIDGVGRLADGKRVYFVVHDTPFGAMADQVVADRRRCVPVPDGVDDAIVAAAMNPAMSSWIALRLRAPLQAGQSVLVLGATGNAGQMAIQIARRLGAGRVIGAGRDPGRLAKLDADEVVSLAGDPDSVGAAIARAASEVDVVIDYLWGQPAEQVMIAMLTARANRSHPINWIQIGSMAGPTMALPSVALRSTNLRVLGSGQGSVPVGDIVAELPRLIEELAAGRLTVHPVRVPLANVEATWTAPESQGQRIVFVPTGGGSR
jgi:NADPH:quinone reductase-like Zn-dependent oxidoreductase